MHALFAQMDKFPKVDPQLDPTAKASAEAGLGFLDAMMSLLTGPVGIGVSLLGLLSLVLFIWVCVVLIQKGSTALGVLSLIGIFCGIGVFIALIGGWVKSGEYKIKGLMTAFTLSFLLYLAGYGYIVSQVYALMADQVKQQKNILDKKDLPKN